MAYFSKTSEKITPESYFSKVKSITVRVCVTNCTGTFILQTFAAAGSVATGWVGHPAKSSGCLMAKPVFIVWQRSSTKSRICVL
jgi:hypothetical protein